MAEVQIGHAFVSTKPDSPDGSIVSSSEWNANEVFKNGVDGQIPVRDTGQVTGARWTQGVDAQISGTGSSSGGTTFGPLGSITVTLSTIGVIIFTANVVATTSAAQALNLVLRRNGVNTRFFNTNGSGVSTVCRLEVFNENPGSYTYDIIGSVSSGTITSVVVDTVAISLGA